MKNHDLQWAREQAGLSVSAAAKLLDVNRSTFSEWENGKKKIPARRYSAFLAVVGATLEEVAAATALIPRAPEPQKQVMKPKANSQATAKKPWSLKAEQQQLKEDAERSLELNGGWDEDGTCPAAPGLVTPYAWFMRIKGDAFPTGYAGACTHELAVAINRYRTLMHAVCDAGLAAEAEANESKFSNAWRAAHHAADTAFDEAFASKAIPEDFAEREHHPLAIKLYAALDAENAAAKAAIEEENERWALAQGLDLTPWWIKDGLDLI